MGKEYECFKNNVSIQQYQDSKTVTCITYNKSFDTKTSKNKIAKRFSYPQLTLFQISSDVHYRNFPLMTKENIN